MAALICCLGALLAVAAASAEVTLCSSAGAGAGQCSGPRGVATDFETGHVYVADRANSRIDVFDAAGNFLFAFGWKVNATTPEEKLQTCTTASGCLAGSAGSGAGQLVNPSGIAVDNVVGSGSRHAIYVTTSDFRVQKFKPDGSFEFAAGWGVDSGAMALQTCTTASVCQAGLEGGGLCQINNGVGVVASVAVGPGGNVFLADSAGSEPNLTGRVEKLSPAGACLGETALVTGNIRLKALAIDAGEDAWVSVDGVPDQLRKYDLGIPETKICSGQEINANALALDAGGRLFASQREPWAKGGGTHQVITEYDPACNPLHRFGYGKIGSNLLGLAGFQSAEGDLFASEESGTVRYLKIPKAGPIVAPESLEAGPIGAVKATIKAEVNPEGKETQVKVQYVDQQSFENEGGFSAPGTKTSAPVTLAPGFNIKGVEVQIGCLDPPEINCLAPETEYRFRVIATNADNPSGGEEGTAGNPSFKTPPHIKSVWASEVGTDSATLNAAVDPLGLATSGYFEYVDDATYQADKVSGDGFQHATKIPAVDPPIEAAPIEFGSGEGTVSRSATPFPLVEATTYHYRVVVSDPLGPSVGQAQSFRTFGIEEAQPCPENDAFRIGPGSLLADCRAYEMVSPLDKEGGDIISLVEGTTLLPAVVNQSAVSGEKLAYGSYRPFGDVKSAPYTSQYIAARGNGGWSTHAINPAAGETLRNGAELDNEFRAFSPDLCEGWVAPLFEPPLAAGAIATYPNLYRRVDGLCGSESYEAITTSKPAVIAGTSYALEMQGRSEDGSVVAFVANAALEGSGAPAQAGCTPGGGPLCREELYVKGPGGVPVFACVLPGGTPSAKACSAGNGTPASRSRKANVANALWSDGKGIFWTEGIGDGPVYLRENPLGAGTECSGAGAPCTVAVSKAGEEASGTSASVYWGAAKDGSVAVFSTADVGTGVSDLYEFAVGSKTTKLIAHHSLGVLGMSEGAGVIYFASSEVLSGSEVNSEGDEAQPGKANLYRYAAAGGGSYRFVGTLASGDVNRSTNRSSSTPIDIQPIHHNGRVSADGGLAVFMSFAPLTHYDNTDAVSGKADTEVFRYSASENGGKGELGCVSCNPSGGRPAGTNTGEASPSFWVAARLPAFENNLYAPRVFSADGERVFFESQDPLVARDSNSRLDVYQWEAPGAGGAGGCEETDTSFSAAAGGCISLISSGQSKRNSELIDSSASGNDVFFATLASLLPQDFGLVDIYDARVGGGLPSPPPPAPECEAEDCQNPPPAPQFQTPSSNTYVGPANAVAAKKPLKCPKGKHKVKKNGKESCVKNKKKKTAKKSGAKK